MTTTPDRTIRETDEFLFLAVSGTTIAHILSEINSEAVTESFIQMIREIIKVNEKRRTKQ